MMHQFSCRTLLTLLGILFLLPVTAYSQEKTSSGSSDHPAASPSVSAVATPHTGLTAKSSPLPAASPSVAIPKPSSGTPAATHASPIASGTPAVLASPGTSPVASASPAVTGSPAAGASPVASPVPNASASPTVPVALPSGVVTSGNPTVIVVNAPPANATPAPTNSWIPGLIGIGLLAAAILFGLRYARQRGMTVESGLKQLGVQMPQDGVSSTVASARPVAAPQADLPSLADLPPPQPAANAVNISALKSKVVDIPPPPVVERPVIVRTASLLGLSGSVVGEVFPLTEPVTIGREKDNSIILSQDGTVSRRHARIDVQDGDWLVTDTGSSNGTFVNGQRLSSPRFLRAGDEVQFGSVRFRFET